MEIQDWVEFAVVLVFGAGVGMGLVLILMSAYQAFVGGC